MSGSTIAAGATFRKRIPNKVRKETWTPDAIALIQRPMGTNRKKIAITTIAKKISAKMNATGTAESWFTSPLLS
jgi:hypothetical protein